ncbi:reverse transcriptase family protein [Saccharicrinis fermentans]|uniref:hypothetical protein n=1 Tax=Saccharicrinis fermentans TaxID=982 RepID=UPI0004BB37E0|nr:hypothetical protein [Saccharicrinis fermentans]
MKRRKRDTNHLIERVLYPANLTIACKEVVRNKGAGGIDGMSVSELKHHLDLHRNQLVEEMLTCAYLPQSIRGKEIPKGGGKTRQLGIPTAIDRMLMILASIAKRNRRLGRSEMTFTYFLGIN